MVCGSKVYAVYPVVDNRSACIQNEGDEYPTYLRGRWLY